jgi:hypothetical protein
MLTQLERQLKKKMEDNHKKMENNVRRPQKNEKVEDNLKKMKMEDSLIFF